MMRYKCAECVGNGWTYRRPTDVISKEFVSITGEMVRHVGLKQAGPTAVPRVDYFWPVSTRVNIL